MVVHSTDEGSKVTKDSLDLTSMSELKLLVYVGCMFHWPVILTALVDGCSICPEFSTRLDFLKQEAVSRCGLDAVGRLAHRLVYDYLPAYP